MIHEPARTTPVVHECDVCVVGGSCTGVFAAVRAAQLGASAAIIECSGFFGGVAAAGLVNIWHSVVDVRGERAIIGGLTAEVIDRLTKRGAARQTGSIISDAAPAHLLNTAELMIELDELVRSQPAIRPFLHARFAAPAVEDGRMKAAIIEDKSGRRAIRAKCFIDASGDGDVIARLGMPLRMNDDLQPPTACMHLYGLDEVRSKTPGFDLSGAVHDPKYKNALKQGFLWSSNVVGLPGTSMVAGTRVHGANCSDADELTRAEMEGRRQARAMRDIIHDNFPGGENVSIAALPSYIGIRETRHATCLHRLTQGELLTGERFHDAIGNGCYPVDVHHSGKAGITFQHLDGRQLYVVPGQPAVQGRWRDESSDWPSFYQIPFRSLVPEGSQNVLVAGRLIDADRGAYGAIRVMVNCNQTGEAAGTAAAMAAASGKSVAQLDTAEIRDNLSKLGAVVI